MLRKEKKKNRVRETEKGKTVEHCKGDYKNGKQQNRVEVPKNGKIAKKKEKQYNRMGKGKTVEEGEDC